MIRLRLDGRGVFQILAAVFLLITAISAGVPLSTPAGASAKGKITLAWHAGFASRWLDPQEHDGTATPDNFFTALHDALIKNQGTALYDHPALAEKFAIAPDAKSATFTLRKGLKFHNGEPVTPQDVKFSYENYRGAKADVFKKKTDRIEIVDDRTIRFVSRSHSSTSRSCSAPPTSPAPAGWCPRSTTSRWARTASSRSRSARGPSSSCVTSRA